MEKVNERSWKNKDFRWWCTVNRHPDKPKNSPRLKAHKIFLTNFYHSLSLCNPSRYILVIFCFQVKFSDPLPKTVCVACVQKLEIHHQLVKRFHAAREHFMESAMNSIRNRSSTSTSCDQSLRCRNSNLNPTSNSSGAEQVTHEYSQADL